MHIRSALTVLTLATVLTLSSFCSAQDANALKEKKITDKEAASGQKLLEAYLQNAKNFQRYSCAILIEKTTENIESPADSTFFQDWYFHSFNGKQNLRRQDDLIRRMSFVGNAPIDRSLAVVGVDHTIFFDDKVVIQRRGFRSENKIKISKEIRKEDWESLVPQLTLEPWELPFFGSVDTLSSPNMSFPEKSIVNDIIGQFTVMDFQETLGHLGVEYRESLNTPMLSRVIYETRQGRMPTIVERHSLAEGYEGVISKIVTKWVTGPQGMYPSEVRMELKQGRPDNPAVLHTHEIFLYWIFDEDVPDVVFEPTASKGLSAVELKELILSRSKERH